MQKTTPLIEAKKRYEDKRKKITISFNTETEQGLLDHARSKKDFGKWVKEQIKEDMQRNE